MQCKRDARRPIFCLCSRPCSSSTTLSLRASPARPRDYGTAPTRETSSTVAAMTTTTTTPSTMMNGNPRILLDNHQHHSNNNNYDLKPGEVSSGTTIMAVACADGSVVLGADSRVSTGAYVANRISDKIAQLSEHIYCCRSGSAADTQFLTDVVKHFLQQLGIQTGRPPQVKSAAHLMQRFCYEYKDRISAGVIVAGWDPVEGGSVYSIPMGGTCLKVPFALGGSGSMFIYGLVDAEYKRAEQQQQPADANTPPLAADAARALVKKAIAHAMARDGSSGGVIRTVIVSAEGNDRDYTPGNALPFGPTGY